MTSAQFERAAEAYGRIGVQPIIHMTGTTTRYGGTIIRPEAQEAMTAASGALVDINELTIKAGETTSCVTASPAPLSPSTGW